MNIKLSERVKRALVRGAVGVAFVTGTVAVAPMALADGEHEETGHEVAERLRDYAEHAANAGRDHDAQAARDAADRCERATPDRARDIDRDFSRGAK